MQAFFHAETPSLGAYASKTSRQGTTEEAVPAPETRAALTLSTSARVARPLGTMEATEAPVRHAHVQATTLPLGVLRRVTVALREATGA